MRPLRSAAVARVGAVRLALPPLHLGLPHAEPHRRWGRPSGGTRLLVPARRGRGPVAGVLVMVADVTWH